MARVELTATIRDFFTNLTSVIALNPFSEERVALIERLAPGRAGGAWSLDPGDYALTANVDRCLAELDRAGRGTLDDFTDEDRDVVGPAYLYQICQRLVPEFDALIKTHERDPEAAGVRSMGSDSIEAPTAARRALTGRDSEGAGTRNLA